MHSSRETNIGVAMTTGGLRPNYGSAEGWSTTNEWLGSCARNQIEAHSDPKSCVSNAEKKGAVQAYSSAGEY
jgi:hypothetical protein